MRDCTLHLRTRQVPIIEKDAERMTVTLRREEQVFDREDVLGRDTTSVFPTESKAQAMDSEAVKAALGSNLRFITESEVHSPCPCSRWSKDTCCLAHLRSPISRDATNAVVCSWRR